MTDFANWTATAIKDFYGDDFDTVRAALNGEHGPEWQAKAESRIAQLAEIAIQTVA